MDNIAATYAAPGSLKIKIEKLEKPKAEAGQVLVKLSGL